MDFEKEKLYAMLFRSFKANFGIDIKAESGDPVKDFLNKYKVLGLAVAFIMGVYLGGLVQSLVADLLLPLIGLALPGLGDLSSYTIVSGSQVFGIGNFLVALITFIIVAFPKPS